VLYMIYVRWDVLRSRSGPAIANSPASDPD